MSDAAKTEDLDLSKEDIIRRKKRKRLARMTPEKKRKFIQYERRHNEKDGIVIYCDYCDLFISSNPKVWSKHLASFKHMDNFEAYYRMVGGVEPLLLREINESVRRAWNVWQMKESGGGSSAAPVEVSPGIVVGRPKMMDPDQVGIRINETVVYQPAKEEKE